LSSRLQFTPAVHACSSRLQFTPAAHACSSRLQLTPAAHGALAFRGLSRTELACRACVQSVQSLRAELACRACVRAERQRTCRVCVQRAAAYGGRQTARVGGGLGSTRRGGRAERVELGGGEGEGSGPRAEGQSPYHPYPTPTPRRAYTEGSRPRPEGTVGTQGSRANSTLSASRVASKPSSE